jgi:hypothetical protein
VIYDKLSKPAIGIKKYNKPKPNKKKVEIIKLKTKNCNTGRNNFAPKKMKYTDRIITINNVTASITKNKSKKLKI